MILIREFDPNKQQKSQFRKAIIITVFGNILLSLIKGGAAYFSNSAALYSDAINSISDVVYSFFLVIGLNLAQKPPDQSHPQGHSRFEPLIGLIITISMTIAGIEALRSSINRFFNPGQISALDISTLALLSSAAIKAVMFFIIQRIAKKILSPGLKATAQDNLSDILTSLAALLGILGSKYLTPVLDPIAGVFVALWIFKAAYEVGRENLNFLTGASPDDEIKEKILETARKIPGVIDIHQMLTEYVGPRVVVDMHIDVDENSTLKVAHNISDKVAEAIELMPEVDRAYVHPEPFAANKASK